MPITNLAKLIVTEGILTQQDSNLLLKLNRHENFGYAKALITIGALTETELIAFLAEHTTYDTARKNLRLDVQETARNKLFTELQSRFEVVPLKYSKGLLQIAMIDPINKEMKRQLEFFSDHKILPVIASISSVKNYLKNYITDYQPQQTALEIFLANHVDTAARHLAVKEQHGKDMQAYSWQILRKEAPETIELPNYKKQKHDLPSKKRPTTKDHLTKKIEVPEDPPEEDKFDHLSFNNVTDSHSLNPKNKLPIYTLKKLTKIIQPSTRMIAIMNNALIKARLKKDKQEVIFVNTMKLFGFSSGMILERSEEVILKIQNYWEKTDWQHLDKAIQPFKISPLPSLPSWSIIVMDTALKKLLKPLCSEKLACFSLSSPHKQLVLLLPFSTIDIPSNFVLNSLLADFIQQLL